MSSLERYFSSGEFGASVCGVSEIQIEWEVSEVMLSTD